MYINKLFTCLSAHISKSKRCVNVKSSKYFFHMKTKTLADFKICISLLLIRVRCSDSRFSFVKPLSESNVAGALCAFDILLSGDNMISGGMNK